MDHITLTPDEFSRAVTALGAGPLPAHLPTTDIGAPK